MGIYMRSMIGVHPRKTDTRLPNIYAGKKLQSEWDKRSKIPYGSKDLKGMIFGLLLSVSDFYGIKKKILLGFGSFLQTIYMQLRLGIQLPFQLITV